MVSLDNCCHDQDIFLIGKKSRFEQCQPEKRLGLDFLTLLLHVCFSISVLSSLNARSSAYSSSIFGKVDFYSSSRKDRSSIVLELRPWSKFWDTPFCLSFSNVWRRALLLKILIIESVYLTIPCLCVLEY